MGRKPKKTYRVIDSWLRSRGAPERPAVDPRTGLPETAYWLLFEGTHEQVMDWIRDGLRGTEGAEQAHYIDLQFQLEDGMTELDYRRV